MASKYQIAFEEEERRKKTQPDGLASITEAATKGTTFTPQPNQQIVSPQENLAQKQVEVSSGETPKSKYQAAYEAESETIDDTLSAWEGIKEAITGARRTTAEVERLPEVFDIGGLKIEGGIGPNLKVATGLLLSHDPKTQIEIIKAEAPETEFRVDKNGNVIGNYKGQEFVLNKPGFSQADAQRVIIDMAAFYPAAKFAGIGKRFLTKLGLAGLGAGLTEKGLEETRESLGAEEKEGLLTSDSLPAAGLAMLAEIPVPVAGAILRRAKPFAETITKRLGAKELSNKIAKAGVVIDEEVLEALREAERASVEAGIDFLPTQATGIKADDILQRVLTEQPASSKIIQKFIEKQDEQSRNAVYNFLAKIAPTSSLIEGPARFKKAAGEAVKKLKEKRKSQTEDLYNKVLKDPPDIDINSIASLIDQKMKDFSPGGDVRAALNKARKLITGGQKPRKLHIGAEEPRSIYKDVRLRKLHNDQMQLRDMIDGVGDKAVSPTAKKELSEIREKLLDIMENPDIGGVPAYGEVRNKFAELSQPIDELQNSLVGRASQLKDTDLRKMSNIIFNPAESNVETVKNVKRVIDSADPEAFPMLLRSSIEEKIEAISKRAKNAPNEFSVALFKNERQRRMLLEVMSPEQRKNAVWLEKALDIAAVGRGLGSDTASKSQIISKLSGTVAAPIIGIIAPATTLGSVGAALSGARLLSTALRQKTLDRRAKVLAETIVNEKWSKDMARIRKLGLETPAAMRQFAQLLNNINADLDERDLDTLQEQGVVIPLTEDAIYNYGRAGYQNR